MATNNTNQSASQHLQVLTDDLEKQVEALLATVKQLRTGQSTCECDACKRKESTLIRLYEGGYIKREQYLRESAKLH